MSAVLGVRGWRHRDREPVFVVSSAPMRREVDELYQQMMNLADSIEALGRKERDDDD